MTDLFLEDARRRLDDAVDLRRRIHADPELGLDNPRTQEKVLDALDGLDLALTTGTATTSVVAVLDGAAEGPTVLLRGDMDALPMPEDTGLEYASQVDGAIHACGHDAHTAMLVGAARLLHERRGELAGRVLFMFQPGEEGHGGAKVMLDEGLLGDHDVSRAFAIHQTPTIPSGMVAAKGGPLLASADTFAVTVTGRGGHASMPHHALDPIPVACELVTSIQSMITRRVDAFDPAVVTVAKVRAGSTTNVVPETAVIEGTIRAVSERTRSTVHDGLRRLAEGIAAAHGTEARCELFDGYPVTVNDTDVAGWVLDAARDLLGSERVVEMPTPVMGAEDFSYVLQEVPGAMAFLGTRPPGSSPSTVAPNHSNRMVIDEEAMATGIALYANVAKATLTPA